MTIDEMRIDLKEVCDATKDCEGCVCREYCEMKGVSIPQETIGMYDDIIPKMYKRMFTPVPPNVQSLESLEKHSESLESKTIQPLESPEDQTIKADAGKLRMTLVPMQILKDIAEVRMYGVQKYPDENGWKKVDKRRYKDALLRHLLAYLEEPDGVDEESGIKHLKHIACNVAFLCELEDKKE